MPLLPHVDKIDYHEAPQVSKPQLTRYFNGRFEIDLEGHFFDGPLGAGAARVHVDRHERLGWIDQQVSPRLEGHLPAKNLGDLLLQVEFGENRPLVLVEPDRLLVSRADDAQKILYTPVDIPVIDKDTLDSGGKIVANDPDGQVLLLVDERGGGRFLDPFFNFLPDFHQVVQVLIRFRAWSGLRRRS